jgi:hypothetical protein
VGLGSLFLGADRTISGTVSEPEPLTLEEFVPPRKAF